MQTWATCKITSNLDTRTSQLDSFTHDVQAIIDKAWAAATEEQVTNATCQSKIISLKQMKRYLSKSESLDDNFDKLIKKKSLLTQKLPKDMDLSKFGLESCKDTICKSQKVFGDEIGIKLLYLHKRYGLNGSHLVHKGTRAWKSKEIDSYIKGLQDVPSYLLPIKLNQQFTRSDKDSDAIADASITFYNGISDFSSAKVQYTTFHELAHYISGSLKLEEDPKWLEVSHWEEDKAKVSKLKFENQRSNFNIDTNVSFSPPKPSLSLGFNRNKKPSLGLEVKTPKIGAEADKMIMKTRILSEAMKNDHKHEIISEYGEVNPLEDIAETIVAYRYNPSKLKEISPKKYDYIKGKVFQGVEFTDQKKCSSYDEKSLREKFLSQVKD